MLSLMVVVDVERDCREWLLWRHDCWFIPRSWYVCMWCPCSVAVLLLSAYRWYAPRFWKVCSTISRHRSPPTSGAPRVARRISVSLCTLLMISSMPSLIHLGQCRWVVRPTQLKLLKLCLMTCVARPLECCMSTRLWLLMVPPTWPVLCAHQRAFSGCVVCVIHYILLCKKQKLCWCRMRM